MLFRSQVIPHITNEIKSRVRAMGSPEVDVVITEIGGTVGDIESLPFLEAARQVRHDLGRDNVFFIHVSLLPYIGPSGELKTKPTQHSVAQLRHEGIEADILLCRTDRPLSKEIKNKIGLFCNLEQGRVFTAEDASSIYEVPLKFHQEGVDDKIVEVLNMWTASPNVSAWENIVEKIHHPKREVTIGMVGKYMELKESYKSLNEAIFHGGIAHNSKVKIEFLDAEEMTREGTLEKALANLDGILVPGGFGVRGIEGKIAAARYAREKKKPYFGICLGMQVAVIEYARNVVGWKDASSAEFQDRKSTRLNSSHSQQSRMPSSA